jgi:hypothetical protein
MFNDTRDQYFSVRDHRDVQDIPINEHVAMQLKIGQTFLDRIVRHAKHYKMSRNSWLLEAIQRKFEGRKPTRIKLNASELMSNRKMVTLRIPKVTFKVMREQCAALGVSKTIFILDACVIMLATYRKRSISTSLPNKLL